MMAKTILASKAGKTLFQKKYILLHEKINLLEKIKMTKLEISKPQTWGSGGSGQGLYSPWFRPKFVYGSGTVDQKASTNETKVRARGAPVD